MHVLQSIWLGTLVRSMSPSEICESFLICLKVTFNMPIKWQKMLAVVLTRKNTVAQKKSNTKTETYIPFGVYLCLAARDLLACTFFFGLDLSRSDLKKSVTGFHSSSSLDIAWPSDDQRVLTCFRIFVVVVSFPFNNCTRVYIFKETFHQHSHELVSSSRHESSKLRIWAKSGSWRD